MKNSIQLLIFTTICFSLNLKSFAQEEKQDWTPFKMEAEFYDQAKVKNGDIFVEKGEEYKIVFDEYTRGLKIKNGSRWLWHGIVFRYSSGKLSSSTTYEYGVRDGEYTSYHSNGEKNQQGVYKNDIKEGNWNYWRQDGTLESETPYEGNEKNGIQIKYNTDGTTKQWEMPFVNGKLNGVRNFYDENGKIKEKATFKDGEKVGNTVYMKN